MRVRCLNVSTTLGFLEGRGKGVNVSSSDAALLVLKEVHFSARVPVNLSFNSSRLVPHLSLTDRGRSSHEKDLKHEVDDLSVEGP